MSHVIHFELGGQNHDEIMEAAFATAKAYFGDRPVRLTRVDVRSQVERVGEGAIYWYAEVEAEEANS